MTQMTYLDTLADMLMTTLEEEALVIKRAEFEKLTHYTERKMSLLEKLHQVFDSGQLRDRLLPSLQKKLKRIETRAAASTQLLQALHRGVGDAQRRVENLQYDNDAATGIYNAQGESVDDSVPLARVSRNF